MQDAVDLILEQWAAARPDLDCSPMAVLGRFARIARHGEIATRRTYATQGLDDATFDILATLRRAGGAGDGMTNAQLMRSAMVGSSAVTQRIDRLEQRGLVRRAPDRRDARARRIHLTPDGRRLIDELLPEHLATEEELLRGLTQPERAQLASLLKTMLSALET